MNAIAPPTCDASHIGASDEYLKLQDKQVMATKEELRSSNEDLVKQDHRREGQVREMDVALLDRSNATTLEQTEHLRRLSLALAMAETHERRALAQDLHDDLGQLMAVIGLKMTAIEKLKLPKSVRGVIHECATAIDQTNRRLRAMAFDLNPPMLDDPSGFGAAMAWLAHEVHEIHGLEVATEDDGSGPMPMDANLANILFRAVREVLVNLAHRAGVTSAKLAHGCAGGSMKVVTVTFVDTGVDHEPLVPVDVNNSWEPISLHQRLDLLGGAFSIQTRPGYRTTVTLAVPLLPDASGRGLAKGP